MLIIELATIGEIWLEDESKPGEVIKAKAGDVLRIEKGTTVKFSSPTKGKGKQESNANYPRAIAESSTGSVLRRPARIQGILSPEND